MPKLLADNAGAQVIVFSMYEAARFVTRALDLGARGYVTKNDDPNAILAAIDKVRTGAIYLGQSVAQTLALATRERANDPLHELTERERQVVGLLGDGRESLGNRRACSTSATRPPPILLPRSNRSSGSDDKSRAHQIRG